MFTIALLFKVLLETSLHAVHVGISRAYGKGHQSQKKKAILAIYGS